MNFEEAFKDELGKNAGAWGIVPKEDFAQRVHRVSAGTEQAVEPGTPGAVKTKVYAPALQKIVERLK